MFAQRMLRQLENHWPIRQILPNFFASNLDATAVEMANLSFLISQCMREYANSTNYIKANCLIHVAFTI